MDTATPHPAQKSRWNRWKAGRGVEEDDPSLPCLQLVLALLEMGCGAGWAVSQSQKWRFSDFHLLQGTEQLLFSKSNSAPAELADHLFKYQGYSVLFMERAEMLWQCFFMPGAEVFNGLLAALCPCRSSCWVSEFRGDLSSHQQGIG